MHGTFGAFSLAGCDGLAKAYRKTEDGETSSSGSSSDSRRILFFCMREPIRWLRASKGADCVSRCATDVTCRRLLPPPVSTPHYAAALARAQ